MKCKAWVIEKRRGRKGPGVKLVSVSDAYARPETIPPEVGKEFFQKYKRWPVPKPKVMQPTPPADHPNAKPCGGHITVTVSLDYEPYFDGSDAIIRIETKCDRCGHLYHGMEVPGYNAGAAEALSRIATEYVAMLPD